MTPVVTVYVHGSGGRYLSLIAQALLDHTELTDPCSGHLVDSIGMLEFKLTGHRDQDMLTVQKAWQQLQHTRPCRIVHSQVPAIDIMLDALPHVNFLHITVEPNDAQDLAYNWYYKNIKEFQQTQDEKLQQVIYHRQQFYKALVLSQPDCCVDPMIFNDAHWTDCRFWASITAPVIANHIGHINQQPKPDVSPDRIFEISWRDLKTGVIKTRLSELATVLGIDLQPARQANALAIIDLWTQNQPRIPESFHIPDASLV